jgi:hypothetical protein
MNNSAFEKLRNRLHEGNPAAIRDILIECEGYCISKLKQKAKCNRTEAEKILEKAILVFREKVLTQKIVAVPNLKEYIFLTCWEIWREKKHGETVAPRDFKNSFYQIARKSFSREIQHEILEGDSRYYDKVFEASRWAYDRVDVTGQKILMLYYHQNCTVKMITEIMNLSGEEEALQLKSHYYDLWMNEVEYLMSTQG